MVYAKQTWADDPAGNTPLTAARLNNIENGILAAATVIPETSLIGTVSTMTAPIIHAGTWVVTPDGSGNATYTFGTPFPNGVLSVLAAPGDLTSSFGQAVVSGATKSSFSIQAHTFTGALVTTIVRVNFIAIGW